MRSCRRHENAGTLPSASRPRSFLPVPAPRRRSSPSALRPPPSAPHQSFPTNRPPPPAVTLTRCSSVDASPTPLLSPALARLGPRGRHSKPVDASTAIHSQPQPHPRPTDNLDVAVLHQSKKCVGLWSYWNAVQLLVDGMLPVGAALVGLGLGNGAPLLHPIPGGLDRACVL